MRILGYTMLAIGLLNFISFGIIMDVIGGDAAEGKIENGRYYVESHTHYREVSHAVFEFSMFDTCFWFSSFPLIVGGGFVLDRRNEDKDNPSTLLLALTAVAFVAGSLPWILPNGVHDTLTFGIYCCAAIFTFCILVSLALRRRTSKNTHEADA
jgi:hypothetical protein